MKRFRISNTYSHIYGIFTENQLGYIQTMRHDIFHCPSIWQISIKEIL